MTSNNEKKLLTKSDINKVFWRSFTVNASFNYERQMNQGAQYALSPILQKLYPDKKELGLTEKIFTAASIIGLLVIGGMSASMVSINPVVAIGSGDSAIKLIDVINGIMPKMLSLFTTLGVYRLLKKGTKPNTILLGIIVVSVLLTAIGIF